MTVVEDVAYADRDGEVLLARIYRPAAGAARHRAVVDVHPGGWHEKDRTAGAAYCEPLAGRGFVVVAVDFRQAPQFTHPAGSADVATAVRWVRAAAGPLDVDPARIGLIGSSSGGHLALSAAIRPDHPDHAGHPLRWGGRTPVDDHVDASVSCVAALWPPVDPLARYRFVLERLADGPDAMRAHYEGLRRGTEAYFGDEATMAAAAVTGLVTAGEASHLPPVWVAEAELDANVPAPLLAAFRQAWREAGGFVVTTVYPGQAHAFAHSPGPLQERFVDDLAGFLATHL